MANGAGWRPDPDPDLDGNVDPAHPRQERYWDGSLWTERVRPAGSAGPADRAADHVPQLHRALAAAADDLDAVDDQISTLFDRTEVERPRPRPADADDLIELFADDDVATDDDEVATDDETSDGAAAVVDRRDIISEYEELTSGTFDDLDAELAAEEPDQPTKAKRRMFRRRAKGTTAVPR
jgi:hypothetical protein